MTAHAITGASGNIGTVELSALAEAVEMALKQWKPVVFEQLMGKLGVTLNVLGI